MIKEGELQSIYHDFRVDGLEEINYQMLRKWQDTHQTANRKWMATALLSIGRRDVIEVLAY